MALGRKLHGAGSGTSILLLRRVRRGEVANLDGRLKCRRLLTLRNACKKIPKSRSRLLDSRRRKKRCFPANGAERSVWEEDRWVSVSPCPLSLHRRYRGTLRRRVALAAPVAGKAHEPMNMTTSRGTPRGGLNQASLRIVKERQIHLEHRSVWRGEGGGTQNTLSIAVYGEGKVGHAECGVRAEDAARV